MQNSIDVKYTSNSFNFFFSIFAVSGCKMFFFFQVVVITGASSGIGEALAHTFYMAGCKVVLIARRKEELDRVRTDLLEMHSVKLIFLLNNL